MSHSGQQSAAQSSLVGLSTRSVLLMRRGGEGETKTMERVGEKKETKEAGQTGERDVAMDEGLREGKGKRLSCLSLSYLPDKPLLDCIVRRQSVNGMGEKEGKRAIGKGGRGKKIEEVRIERIEQMIQRKWWSMEMCQGIAHK